MAQSHIFLTGATGYVGGVVLSQLLLHLQDKPLDITILVRSPAKAEVFNKLHSRLHAVAGDLGDADTVASLAEKADFVFNCADADHLQAVQAILRGLKKRQEATGKTPVLIHTSGTGILVDDAKGDYPSKTIYSDLDIDAIESISSSAPHRIVDSAIVQADKDGYARTYILLPSTIWGISKTQFTKLKLANPHSIQIPSLVRLGLKRGQGGVYGPGKNVWGDVYIDDLGDYYMKLFTKLLQGDASNLAHGREGFYFVSADEYDMYTLCERIAASLFKRGKGKAALPTPFTEEEKKQVPFLDFFGTNSRPRGDRGRRDLGWEPKKTTRDMLDSLEEEVVAIVSE